MSNDRDKAILESEASFESLLGRAQPRPMPGDVDNARRAVHSEWQAVVHDRKRRRRFSSLAVAAAVFIALAVVVNLLTTPITSPVQVAAIDKSIGSIYFLGDESRLQLSGDLATISAGQTIVTGDASGLGLQWGAGGSLRLGENTRVTFSSGNSIELRSGQVYFDSMNGHAELVLKTAFGEVQHVGTQYMASVNATTLSVSVREGSVNIDGSHSKEVATARQQLNFTGSARVEVLNIEPYGDNWRWVEMTAPSVTFSGASLYDVLQWVGHETGYTIQFASLQMEDVAKDAIGRDEVDSEPRTALRQLLAINHLTSEFDSEQGVIRILERE